jgi:hypothetical protein
MVIIHGYILDNKAVIKTKGASAHEVQSVATSGRGTDRVSKTPALCQLLKVTCVGKVCKYVL